VDPLGSSCRMVVWITRGPAKPMKRRARRGYVGDAGKLRSRRRWSMGHDGDERTASPGEALRAPQLLPSA